MNGFTIRHLFISPGHNFFGHRGQEAGKNPIYEVNEIMRVAGHGVRGDRFFDYEDDYKWQITFFRTKSPRRFAVRWAQMFAQSASTAAMSLPKEWT